MVRSSAVRVSPTESRASYLLAALQPTRFLMNFFLTDFLFNEAMMWEVGVSHAEPETRAS